MPQRSSGITESHISPWLLPVCSIYSLGPCAISSTVFLSQMSPRDAVPKHAISHCHSSPFLFLFFDPALSFSSNIIGYMILLSWKKTQKNTKQKICYFQQPGRWHISSYNKKVSIACT